MRVLVVESDPRTAATMATALRRWGYDVSLARTAAEALDAVPVDAVPVDVVLLDLVLPDADGVEVCRTLRRRDESLAIIVVTARGDERDRVVALYGGADDYLVKPCSLPELRARIEAVTRRTYRVRPSQQVFTVGPLAVDAAAHRVTCDGREVSLTRKEFEILAVLVQHPGMVVTHDRLMLAVWQSSWVGRHTLDVHVGSLRAKLDVPDLVQTVRGVGYRIRPG